jgi:hypothetical protein
MLVRRLWSSSLMCAALLAGCGSADQPRKQSQAASPGNEQGTPDDRTPNDPSDDPSNEGESTPPSDQPPTSCSASEVASIDGWTKHTNGNFTFQVPSSWTAIADTAGYTEVTKKLAIGAGFHAYVRETAVAGTPDDGAGRIGDYPSDVATSAECVVQSGTIPGTYMCDPMANARLVCKSGRGGTTNVWWRFVYHGGHTFEVWCNVSNVPDPDNVCAKLLDTLEIHM